MTSRRRVPRLHLLPVVLALLLAGASCDAPADDDQVRIGAGSTSEQQLLAALGAELLSREDVPVTITSELGGTVGVRDAALSGRIDLFWDYTGAAWTLGMARGAPAVDAQESFEAVAAEDADDGLLWLGPSGADARLAFFVAAEQLPAEGEATLSWLAGRLGAGEGSLCADRQYLSAPAGYAYLADTYAIATDSVTTVAASETKAIDFVDSGECLAGLATATSGSAHRRGLASLVDDQGVFPAMTAAPVVVEGGRADEAPVRDALVRLAESLDTETLSALNGEVVDGTPIDEVAVAYLDEVGLG